MKKRGEHDESTGDSMEVIELSVAAESVLLGRIRPENEAHFFVRRT